MTKRRNLRRRNLRTPSRSLHHEALEKRELLAAEVGGIETGPRLISVAANSGEQFDLDGNNQLDVAPRELTFRFDGAQPLDPNTLAAIQIRASGGDGSFDDGNEETIIPGFLGFADDNNSRIVVARFAETLPDDQYVIEVAGFDDTDPNGTIVGLRNQLGELFCPPGSEGSARPMQQIFMDIEVGPQVVAIVPQPIVGVGAARMQLRDTIHVYFNDDPLSNPNAGVVTNSNSSLPVVNPQFYKLLFTEDTVENTDDTLVLPTTVEYDPALNRAVLTFTGNDLSDLVPTTGVDGTMNNGAGTFRLRVGRGEALPSAPTSLNGSVDAGDTFAAAAALGVPFGNAGTQSVVVTGGVIQAAKDVIPQWPGAADAAGVRDYRRDAPVVGRTDTQTGINVYEYNFANLYGLDPQENNLENAITPAQEQRAREILALYSERLGVEFVETQNRGLQIVTGDLRALAVSADTGIDTPFSIYRVNDADPSEGVLVLDAGENWYDGYGVSPDTRPSWFVEALRGVGALLGIGNTFELPAGDASGGSSPDEPNSLGFTPADPGVPVEPDFLTEGNIIVGQALHRPESDDVDFYSFRANSNGRVTLETFAQRLEASSMLDSRLSLYQVIDPVAGDYRLVATNDDFFSDDSFISVDLELPRDATNSVIPTDFIIGVSASGNDNYNGEVDGSALGGLTEGAYDLRVTFESQVGATITDSTLTELDGDADGRAGGDFNFWFRVARDTASPAADEPRVIFVDKFEGNDNLNSGTLTSPLQTIASAFAIARPNDIVRLLPNGGNDDLISTTDDNLAFEIGFGGSGTRELSDGGEFEVPQGVTVMIDAGAILKLRTAKISVGSESVDEDRSLAALQVLGTPQAVDAAGDPLVDGLGSVFFTSYDDATLGVDTNTLNVAPQAGNWAGIEFRNDFDFAEGRAVWESEGIFLDYSSHASIQYGGGSVSPTQPAINALFMAEARPTLIYNTITDNADAAISADPNSFRETNFHEPQFQRVAAFTSDYSRVGPEITGNTLLRNTTNGLFVRVVTPAAGQLAPMEVAGRFDDHDIVHVLSQVLVLQGQPGGPLLLEDRPDVLNVTFGNASGGSLTPSTIYDYRITFVTEEGRESLASLPTAMKTAPLGGSIVLNSLPTAPAEFAGRRIYRLDPASGDYIFVTQLDRGTTSYTDDGTERGGLLPAAATAASRTLPRFDARLSIDPGLIIKLENSRIEAGFGSDFYAEGVDGDPVVFTSRLDDRYGAGGTYDTNNNPTAPSPGDWGGLVFRQDATASLDYVEIQYGGGSTPIEGGFTEFNAIEILQADVRIAHSVITDNADGFNIASVRGGRGFNGEAAIFVRGAQPIIVDNTITNNEGAAISINPDALNFNDLVDYGRSTGTSDIFVSDQDNQGPLIAGNRLDRNDINGLEVRSEVLQTESVWDDTDIVHVVSGDIHTDSHHHRGGLRLKSDANQSLVVKFDNGATLIGSGHPLDIEDRIGGTLQVIGQGGFPVIMTSLADDSVGAGFTPEGIAQTNTDNVAGTPAPGDWGGIELRSYVNDRNVAYVIESARAIPAANNENALADDAQVIGDLASHQYAGDESERLGFNIRGALASADDQDVYRFTADGGTVVYIDIDDTSFGLDTIVEVIDVNDNVLARSDSSFEEATNPGLLVNNLTPGSVLPLFQLGAGSVESPNSLDAGMRVILDGTGKDNEYYVRVRTANGQSSGQYQLSIRLQETDEVAGSTVQLADIRFATDAITVSGAPLHSPLAGDATEDLNADGTDVDNTVLAFTEANAAHIGNLLTSDRGSLRVSGTIGNLSPALAFEPSDEVDVYQVDLFRQEIEPDVFDSENRFVSVTFDVDYADQLGRVNSSLSIFDSAGRLILHSRDSNVADDVGRPLEGDDPTNLTGGSTGVLDAYIGPVELPEGTYYVAVSSAIAIPSALDQLFVDAAPTDTNVRLMPINSIRRIADDRLDTGGADLHFGDQYTADRPIISPLFTDESIVPYGIDDVRLFVSYDGGISGGNRSSLASFNPFTGVMDRLIGQSGQPTGDIAARRDGELFAFSLGPQGGPENNGNVGNFLNISPANGAAVNVGDDGVTYMRNNQAGNDLEADPNAQLDVLALTFPLRDGSSVNTQAVNANERFFTVGQRDNNGRGGEIPDIYATNIFYTNVSSTGETTSLGSTDATFHRQFNGTIPYFPFHESTSPDIEWGFVDTGAVRNPGGFNACIADANCDGGEITGIAVDADAATTMYAVTDQGGFHVFDYTVNVPGLGGFLAAASNVIPTNYLGKLAPDPLDFASQNRGFIQFEGLSLGPRGITNQAYRDVFYGVSAEGWLYAFQIDGGQLAPAHVFYNGLSAIPLTFEGGASAAGASPHGLAFSIQEQNPWHFTDDRRADNGHGTVQTYDQSRINVVGDGSLYFGFEITGNAADNTVSRPDDDPLGEISPGGTQGSVISKAFSLEGYSPDDKPTLYFSYFLEVEDNDDYQPGPTQQRDSFRAYAAGDDGNWLLLATNNSFRDLGNNDEYDSYDTTDIPVQTLFDDSDAWRQARVDLSPLAGNENVKIRFDFSNAGAVRQTFGALELVAVDGDQIDDRSQLILRNEDFETVTLDSIVGKNVVIPAGSALADGDGFTVVGPDGPFTVTFITGLVPANPGEVSFSVSQSALEIAEAVINAVPASLRAISDGNGTISFLGATDVIVLGDSPIGQSNPVDIRQTSDQLIVPAGVNISSFDELTVNGLGTTTRFLFVEAVDATGAPDEFIFSPTESAFDIGARLIELLPDALDAVLELDGRITFIQGPITFAFGASDAVNTVGNLTVLENRLEIFVADGDNLVDGSQLVITDAFSGTTTITFVLNTVSEGPGTVNFFSGDTSLDIATRLQAALPASMDVRINITNDGIVLLADDANGAPNVFDQPIGGETITFPDGSVPLQNDTLRLIDQFLVTTVIDFVRVTVPTPPTVAVFNPVSGNNEGTVFFQTSDTPDIIAANYALATDPFYVNVNKGDTIESFGAFDSTTTDPDSSIINDANLGQFIQLPPSGGMIDGESIQISSPFGNVQVQFVNQAFGFGNQVFYNANESSAVIQSRLQALLPSNLRAIVTQNGTSGPVVQILGATDITVFNPMSLILTGPNAYSRDVLNLDIKDGNQIRNGEQIVIDSPFTAPVTLTFVRAGSTSNAPGTIEIFYSTTDLAADLYDRILQSLPQNLQSYIALDDDGVNVGVPGATGVVIPGIPPATSTTTDIDEFAIPIILPAGNELNDGEVLTIIRKDDIAGAQPINIFFRMGVGAAGPNEVVYALTDTQAQITQKLYDALPRSVQAFQVSSRELYLLNAASVATQAGSSIISFELAVGAIPLQVDSAMSSSEVADKLRIALAEAFGRLATVDGTNNALPDDYPVIGGNRIRIYNSLIVDPGSFSASSFDVNTVDPFDAFSTFSSSALPSEFYGLSRPTSFAGSQIDGAGGANNNIEGVYIDDIIVGFAERGEMVLDAPVNRTFTLNPEVIPDNRPQAVQPERQNETLTGGYSLDIRTSDEFGVPQDYDPINLLLQEESGLGRSFDTNDRLVDGAVTLIAQAGTSLIDGDTFVINDGTRQLTFEFDSILETGVTIGNVAVPFDPIGIEARDVATSIRNAINSPQSRGVLDISAATGNSQEVGGASGTHVELFGPAISINPGGGRFLKVDLVEEETFQGRETSKLFPVIDHDNQTVTYVSQGDQQARAAVTGFVDGTVDVLVATGKIGDQVNTGETVDDAPVVFFNAPGDDVDYVRIYLTAGQTIDIDLDTVGFARGAEQLELPVITVLDGDGGTSTNGLGGLAQTSLLNTSAAPGEAIGAAFLKFQATTSGYYDVAVSSSPFFAGGGFFFGADFGEYSLTIRPDAATSAAIPDRDVLMVDYHFGNSDENRVKDQGQIIIASNFISDSQRFGVFATTGSRGEAFATNPQNNGIVPEDNPRPGSVNLLRNINTDGLIPGAVINNNVVVNSGAAGIRFSGGTAGDGEAPAPVPYGRIVNNTVVGSGGGSGIQVASNAAPTLLNNLVSGFATGLDIDASSENSGTIVGGNAFQNNATDSTIALASSSISINGPVFQDPTRRIYIPIDGSTVIDSSFSELADRFEYFNTVKDPVGISASPIKAPVFDAYGQPRFDDPLINPPGAGGEIVTIDRGAIDRADRSAMIAVLTGPQDSIGAIIEGGDGDPDESFVRLSEGRVEFFEVQLLDEAGTGPDKDTITPESVLLTENGRRLIPDVDFVFSYNDNSRTIRLTPLAGLWLPDAVYEITLNNQQRIQYEVPSGSEITDGDQVIVQDTSGNELVFEYESGFSLSVPQTTLLTITGPNADFQDRDTFTISSPGGNTLAFEINLAGATAGGNVPVQLASASTIGEVRDVILATLDGTLPNDPLTTIKQFLDIDPVAIGTDQIQLGTLAGHTIPVSISGLGVTGQAGGVADSESFTFTSPDGSVVVEFDSDGSASGDVVVPITRTDTPGEIAASIALALQTNVPALSGVISVDDGTVVLGGNVGETVAVDQSSLVLNGAPGVTGSLSLTVPPAETGSSIDDSAFTVDVDGVAITFRYTTDPMFTSPDRLILLSPTDLVNGIASKSAAVIALAFPDELSPTSVGDTIILGEQAAIPPTGQPGSFTTVDGGTAGLLPGGVSGGAIPVSYLPSSPRTSIAATLQGRIADSPLQVETFSPGGGTILISDAQSLSAVTSGTLQAGVGVLTPAVADLAGNAVRETRINNETRFTIIMPDVLFDLGDAPISYSTLFRDNGARHTVGGPELPRLGQFVDTEEDALVVNLDDAPFDVSLNQTPIAPALFTIDSITIPDADVISLNRMPAGGETLTIAVGPIFTTFELVEITSNPVGANVAVNFSDMDTIEEVNAKLLATIRATLTQTDDGLLIEQDSPTSIIIIAVDDEDGVSEGVFSDGTTNRTVFTVPGTNPSNIQAEDVLGFLNPQDPAGTNIAVTVAGSGLLHGWIDFDKNGVFDSSEQVLKNVPVSGDPVAGSVNFVTVFTPPTALEGDTWMRLRISESGNLLPTGVAVGGEVEDYPVQIISIPLPVPEDDVYQISEDNTLDTLTDGLPSLDGVGTATPDFIPPEAFLPPQFIAGVLPQNGTLVSLDPNTGHFVYLPNNDFNGVDTFTYRLSTQQNASASVIDQDEFATVTISVAPVNDPPGATDQAYTAVEDGPLVISAAELLATASADSDAQGTTPDPLDPNLPFLNEENQQLYVASVQGIGAVITAANAASAAGNLVVTTNGSGIDLQVSNITDSDVVSLAFAGTTVTFELVPENGIPSGGTVAIPMVSTDSTASVAARLQNAIQAAFTSSTPAILVGQSGDTVSVSFTPLTVSAVGSAAFTVTPGAGSLIVDVSAVPTPTAAATPADPNPVVGDTLTLTYGTSSVTFELIAEGATAAAGNTPITVRPFAVPVAPPVGASAADVARFTAAMNAYNAALRASAADQLNSAIQTELLANNVGVTSTIVDGATSPNRIDVQAAAITAGKSFDTPRGSAIAVFDGFGDLIELRYISNQDLNRDNPPPATPTHLDSFVYTVRDSGVSIDLTNSVVDYGMPGFSTPPTSVVLDVAPQNDAPILNPDLISVGPLGPDAGTVLTAWEIFGGATPTEDTTLQIDPAFLLSNDMRARMTAADENVAGSLNDLGLSIQSVTMANPAQGSVTRLFDGTIVFTPAPDIFGDIIFTYSARDQGINESVNGVRTAVPLISFDGTVTVSVQPVNDIPVAFDRALDFTESADPGPGDPFVFTSDELIFGDVGETANIPGSFPPALQAPFNESEQTLRVVAFTTAAGTVDASSLTGTGAEMLTLPSDAGGTFEFDFVDGVFTVGRFVSSADYNARTPFAASESFSYVIADDGLTTDPQNSGNTFTLPDSRSDDDVAAVSAVVTITVGETNDAPTFGLNAPVIGGLPTIDVLERDDMVGTTINGFAVNIMPGPSSASDEIDRQSVVFSFPANLNPSSNVPDGLFTQLPELSPTGQLTVFPAPDAIGTATIVVLAEDLEPGTVGFTPRQTLATFVVNVQPVNDRPRFDPALFGTGDSDNPDEAYDIAQGVDFNNDGLIDQATISYTLREDNTQPLGVLEEYFIPLRAAASVGYSRLGLLDVFTVGPDNEAGAFPGGVQTLEFLRGGNDPVSPSLDRTTDRGGILTPVFDTNDVLIGLNYQPPLDFNIAFAGVDSFTYEVRDDSTTGGETYSLAASALIPDRRVSSNRVELRLNPVNDRPQFDTTTLNIDVQEDSAEVRLVNYASNISAGPPATAFDEVDVLTGQLVEFTVTSLDFPREESDDFFTIYPSVDNNTGLLNFRPAADVFGEYRFELVLNDSNRDGSISDNTTRGDLISSIPVTLTINVQPVNDPPLVDPGAAPLNFTILEDGSFEILIDGDNTSPGLLDPFFPGPAVGATDESADISPLVGGNQTVSLGQPVPSNSAQGGTVQLITTGGSPRLRYTPRTNFVGMDSFIYTVTDDGITVLPDGSQISDPKIASNIVTFDVQPVNDAPRFSGAANVQSNEDGGVIAIENWAANILAGPVTATDEVSGVGTAQSLGFVFTQVSSNPELFTTPPTAVIDPITGTAVLTYEAAPDANGIATFEVLLEDNGPRDASIGDEFRSDPPRTFLINVQPVNDPPSFDLVNSQISRVEDSGPFNVIQAINVSPGPADEAGQTVTFELEPLAPQFASLFSEQPSINADGLLRFTPAPNQNTDNANGPAIIRVFARDSESPAAVSDSVEFQIAISEVNDAPRAFSDAIRSDEDTVLTISSAQLLANDIDPDLQSNVAETVSIVMPQVSTSVSGAQVVFDPATGEITYDPSTSTALQSLAPNEQLVDSFAYSLIDASGATSNLVTVGLTIDGINDAPVLNLDAPQLNPDGSTTIAVLANDSDVDGFIDPSSLQITLQPAFGSVVVLPNGSLEYTPFASFPQDGVDEFTYTVADNLGLRSEEAIVSISSNASPIAVGDARGTFVDESIIIDVAANDSDPDGTLNLSSIVIVSQPNRGQAVPQSDGTVQYLPDPGFLGRDTFQYRIADDLGRFSNIADVETQVVASRLQNPDRFSDVNDDGAVSAVDALLIINRLSRSDSISIPVTEADRGPNFFDTNGNQNITASDALRVINELSRLNAGPGISGEQVDVLPLAAGEAEDVSSTVASIAPVDLLGPVKIVDTKAASPVAADVIDLIAAERESNSDDESSLDAIDAAMADLL